MLEELHAESGMDALKEWIEDSKSNLIKGICLVQDLITPGIDYDRIDSYLMDLVNEICVDLKDDQTVMEQVQLYNHFFYHRIHFRPVDPMFKYPSKAFIDHVIEKKEGSPIAMGLIYLILAFNAGISIRGIVFRGGFLPAVFDNNNEVLFYVNVYKDGSLFLPSQLELFVKEVNVSIPRESFKPALPLDLVQIYAESLFYSFSTKEDAKSKKIAEKLHEMLGLFGQEGKLIVEEDEEDDEY